MQTKDARSHALVVVDDVELVASRVEEFLETQGVSQRLAETRAHHDPELGDVRQGRELRGSRHAKGVRTSIEVKTRHGSKADAFVQFGPGLAGKNFNTVTEGHQFSRQVTGIDALAAACRVASIDQEGDAVLAWLGRASGNVLGHGDRTGAGPGSLGGGDGFGDGASHGSTFLIGGSSILLQFAKRHK